MSLRFRFWGTRGSIASPGAQTARYGGNTPCLEVRNSADVLTILDAGTGIRAFGRWLVDEAGGGRIKADIFVTHAHWDHIQGLPFFAPLYTADNHFGIWGMQGKGDLERVVRE